MKRREVAGLDIQTAGGLDFGNQKVTGRNKLQAGGHDFTEAGGKCWKCGIAWGEYFDDPKRPECKGRPEQRERQFIED